MSSTCLLSESPPFHARVPSIIPVRLTRRECVALLLLQVRKVPQQLIQTTGKGEQHQRIDAEELDNVDNHAAQGDLQGPKMRIYREQMHEFQRRKDIRCSEESFSNQLGIKVVPVLPGNIRGTGILGDFIRLLNVRQGSGGE